MKTEAEINTEIRYAQGYLDGLQFTSDKTDAETRKCAIMTHKREVKQNIWLRLARGFDWAFGTILVTTIGVIVSLKDLSSYGRWVLIVGLLLFFLISLVRLFDDAGWFKQHESKR